MNENLKKPIGIIISIGIAFAKAMEDSKLSAGEALEIGFKSVTGGVTIFRNWKEIREQYASLDAVGIEDIKLWVQTEFDLPDDRIEKIIEKGFNLVVDADDFVKAFKA